MDQIKIGKFIAQMRKEQNLTQIDLAEALGISNKTVSKWECGNGMPDYSVVEELCKILKINTNELLSGERLPSKDYNKKAEENIMSLMQESSDNKKRGKRDTLLVLLGITALFILFGLIIIMSGGMVALNHFIDVPTVTYMLAVTMLVLALAGMLKDFFKAFLFTVKSMENITSRQIKKSMYAVKTAVVTLNIVGILAALIAVGEILRGWTRIDQDTFPILISLALLSMAYSLMFTLVLIPIYIRLKNKLPEEYNSSRKEP